MIDRLEKFRAPPSWHHFIPGAVIICIVLAACNLDMSSAITDEKVRAESAATGAAQGYSVLPLAHPLGCPEEDEAGRKLIATMSVMGEKRPRCVYRMQK